MDIILGIFNALPEMVNTAHRGTSGKVPVELIVFYAGAPGMALSH